MSLYTVIAQKIIEHQETIIGPVAVQQAQQVQGITIDWTSHSVVIDGNEKHVIDKLINQYSRLFGQIAVEVSKEAVATISIQLSQEVLPDSLK